MDWCPLLSICVVCLQIRWSPLRNVPISHSTYTVWQDPVSDQRTNRSPPNSPNPNTCALGNIALRCSDKAPLLGDIIKNCTCLGESKAISTVVRLSMRHERQNTAWRELRKSKIETISTEIFRDWDTNVRGHDIIDSIIEDASEKEFKPSSNKPEKNFPRSRNYGQYKILSTACHA